MQSAVLAMIDSIHLSVLAWYHVKITQATITWYFTGG